MTKHASSYPEFMHIVSTYWVTSSQCDWLAVTATLNSACSSFPKLVSREQRHIAHVIREFVSSTAAKYLSICAKQTFNDSWTGKVEFALMKAS